MEVVFASVVVDIVVVVVVVVVVVIVVVVVGFKNDISDSDGLLGLLDL
jgi:hypothetical protein